MHVVPLFFLDDGGITYKKIFYTDLTTYLWKKYSD